MMKTLIQKQSAIINWALQSNTVDVGTLLYSVVQGFIIIMHIVLH